MRESAYVYFMTRCACKCKNGQKHFAYANKKTLTKEIDKRRQSKHQDFGILSQFLKKPQIWNFTWWQSLKSLDK